MSFNQIIWTRLNITLYIDFLSFFILDLQTGKMSHFICLFFKNSQLYAVILLKTIVSLRNILLCHEDNKMKNYALAEQVNPSHQAELRT